MGVRLIKGEARNWEEECCLKRRMRFSEQYLLSAQRASEQASTTSRLIDGEKEVQRGLSSVSGRVCSIVAFSGLLCL